MSQALAKILEKVLRRHTTSQSHVAPPSMCELCFAAEPPCLLGSRKPDITHPAMGVNDSFCTDTYTRRASKVCAKRRNSTSGRCTSTRRPGDTCTRPEAFRPLVRHWSCAQKPANPSGHFWKAPCAR